MILRVLRRRESARRKSTSLCEDAVYEIEYHISISPGYDGANCMTRLSFRIVRNGHEILG